MGEGMNEWTDWIYSYVHKIHHLKLIVESLAFLTQARDNSGPFVRLGRNLHSHTHRCVRVCETNKPYPCSCIKTH